MKKVLVAALALVSLSASAQKGTILVGGDVEIATSKTPSSPNDTKSNELYFMPTVGYQFNDNWTAGIKANIGSVKNTNSANVADKYSAIGVGPFVRYTKSLSNIFSLYGQLEGEFGNAKHNSNKYQSSTKINLFPAAFINLKNNFGLNFSFGGITYGSTKPTGGKASNSFNFNFGSSANIGISKNFSIKKK